MFFKLTLGSTKKSTSFVNKKMFHIEVNIAQQNYASHKKYIVATKKLCDTQKKTHVD